MACLNSGNDLSLLAAVTTNLSFCQHHRISRCIRKKRCAGKHFAMSLKTRMIMSAGARNLVRVFLNFLNTFPKGEIGECCQKTWSRKLWAAPMNPAAEKWDFIVV